MLALDGCYVLAVAHRELGATPLSSVDPFQYFGSEHDVVEVFNRSRAEVLSIKVLCNILFLQAKMCRMK